MSQQTITNGPSNGENGNYKNDILNQDSPKPPSSVYDPTTGVRPPLNRLDSRTNFIRPPFPTNQPQIVGGAVGPPQVRLPQSQVRPVPPGGQFLQRGPPSNIRGPIGPQVRPPLGQSPGSITTPQPFPSPQNQGQPGSIHGQTGISQGQVRPGFRSPFPRSPLPPNQRPQIFQQRSVPSFGGLQRPSFFAEDSLLRSQTLDSSDLDISKYGTDQQSRSPMEPRPPSVNSSRGFSVSPNTQSGGDIRRHTGSTESLNSQSAHGSAHGSLENLSKDIPSRPGSRMNKINENGDGIQNNKGHDIHAPNPEEPPAQQKSPEPIITNNESEVIKDTTNDKQIAMEKDLEKKDMELKLVNKIKKEGDNDSGVDESTQGNDRSSNGDARSPRKASKPRVSATTPTPRSLSRGSKTPSLQSPDSTATTPGSASEKKKIPMNKIQVGSAPSPNLKVVKSKIGSLQNTGYKPGGGNVKIETKKLDIKATPRIEAKNDKYVSKGGEKKITQQKLQWNAKSKIGSLENATYKPKGGDKKIESVKLEWKAQSKIGSKDNIKHQPGGGDVKIETKKLDIHAHSKIGSMDNMKHRPGGGEKKIFDDKDYLKQQKSDRSSIEHSLSGSQNSIPSQPDGRQHGADENLNQEHHKN